MELFARPAHDTFDVVLAPRAEKFAACKDLIRIFSIDTHFQTCVCIMSWTSFVIIAIGNVVYHHSKQYDSTKRTAQI